MSKHCPCWRWGWGLGAEGAIYTHASRGIHRRAPGLVIHILIDMLGGGGRCRLRGQAQHFALQRLIKLQLGPVHRLVAACQRGWVGSASGHAPARASEKQRERDRERDKIIMVCVFV
jgi:hypothetical protein